MFFLTSRAHSNLNPVAGAPGVDVLVRQFAARSLVTVPGWLWNPLFSGSVDGCFAQKFCEKTCFLCGLQAGGCWFWFWTSIFPSLYTIIYIYWRR